MCLVYDTTDSESFESLNYWVDELNEKAESTLLAVCASKIDRIEQ